LSSPTYWQGATRELSKRDPVLATLIKHNHFRDRSVDAQSWLNLADEAVIEQLIAVRGIGRWTAEMFLIFNLGRPDILPVGDLGLRRAMSLNYNRGREVSERRMRSIAKAWEPWRSVGTWYMWRSLDPMPVEY
jgi:DNA-3-methyladenine glycosylase II